MRKATVSFVMSVCLSAWYNSAAIGQISMIFFFSQIVPFMSWCEKMWYSHTGDNIMWCRKHTLCMPDNQGKSTDTHSQHLILHNSGPSAAVFLNGCTHEALGDELSRCLNSRVAEGMQGVEYLMAERGWDIGTRFSSRCVTVQLDWGPENEEFLEP